MSRLVEMNLWWGQARDESKAVEPRVNLSEIRNKSKPGTTTAMCNKTLGIKDEDILVW